MNQINPDQIVQAPVTLEPVEATQPTAEPVEVPSLGEDSPKEESSLKLSQPAPPIELARPFITMTEMLVIIDTLTGSLRVDDKGSIWRFNLNERMGLTNSLLQRFNDVRIGLKEG